MQLTRRNFFAGAAASVAVLKTLRADDEAVPAFHKGLPKGPLPETKDPAQYAEKPLVMRVYALAGKIRSVLYQMPCYCSCDKFAGHGSLLDCFVDAHGEECAICQREAVYSYVQTKAGVPPRKIREAIIAGAWRQQDMSLSYLETI